MRKILTAAFLILFTVTGLKAQKMIMQETQLSVQSAAEKIQQAIDRKGLTVFNVIDHKTNAAKVGMELPGLTLIVFGNPEVGSKLMKADPRVGVDLPMKILVYAEGDQTKIGFYDPMLLLKKYDLEDRKEILSNMQKAMAGFAKAGVE